MKDEPRDERHKPGPNARDYEPTNAAAMRGIARDLLADGERDARARVPAGDNEWHPEERA